MTWSGQVRSGSSTWICCWNGTYFVNGIRVDCWGESSLGFASVSSSGARPPGHNLRDEGAESGLAAAAKEERSAHSDVVCRARPLRATRSRVVITGPREIGRIIAGRRGGRGVSFIQRSLENPWPHGQSLAVDRWGGTDDRDHHPAVGGGPGGPSSSARTRADRGEVADDDRPQGHRQPLFITSFAWFLLGGVLALLIRTELFSPGLQVVDDPDQFNQFFTMHGTIMLLLFATPLFAAFANAIVPLQIGSPDVAFPRLKHVRLLALSVRRADRRGRVPHSGRRRRVRVVRLCTAVHGDVHPGWAGICGCSDWRSPASAPSSVRQLHHDDRLPARARDDDVPDAHVHLECPDHLPARHPVFPVLAAAALRARGAAPVRRDRVDAANGGAMLWQHLFWFFGHPEVYIIALPFFGIVSEVIPVFSRSRSSATGPLVFATIAIAALSMAVWAHHMYVTGRCSSRSSRSCRCSSRCRQG